MKSLSVTIQMKATEQNFPVVLFIMLYKMVLTPDSVDEILKCDHSGKLKLLAVFSCSAVYFSILSKMRIVFPSWTVSLKNKVVCLTNEFYKQIEVVISYAVI